MDNTIRLLIGAGSSIPAGYPSTEEITSEILTNPVYEYDWGTFYKVDENQKVESERSQIALSVIKRFSGPRRPYTYEEIFSAIEKVSNESRIEASPFFCKAREYDEQVRMMLSLLDRPSKHRSVEGAYNDA